MFSLLAVGAFMGAVRAVERPFEALARTTAMYAGAKRGVKKMKVSLKLLVTREEFERISKNPDVRQGLFEAVKMREAEELGRVP